MKRSIGLVIFVSLGALFVCLMKCECFFSLGEKQKSPYFKYFKAGNFFYQKRFHSKIQKTPPDWMVEQIREDCRSFSGRKITIRSLDQTHHIIHERQVPVIRYRIVNNELYFFHSDRSSIDDPAIWFQKRFIDFM